MARRGGVTYEYPRPAVTVDMVLLTLQGGRLETLLIRRAHAPFRDRWALPGGFVDEGETLEAAARRELLEETGVRAARPREVGAFGDPGRDPRGWTVSIAFYAVLAADRIRPRAADDARAVTWAGADRPPPLAFDHRKILGRALETFREELYRLPVAKPLLPRTFPARRLREVYTRLDRAAPESTVLMRRLRAAGVVEPAAGRGRQYRFAGSRGSNR